MMMDEAGGTNPSELWICSVALEVDRHGNGLAICLRKARFVCLVCFLHMDEGGTLAMERDHRHRRSMAYHCIAEGFSHDQSILVLDSLGEFVSQGSQERFLD